MFYKRQWAACEIGLCDMLLHLLLLSDSYHMEIRVYQRYTRVKFLKIWGDKGERNPWSEKKSEIPAVSIYKRVSDYKWERT